MQLNVVHYNTAYSINVQRYKYKGIWHQSAEEWTWT
jgi:hypothetical protein